MTSKKYLKAWSFFPKNLFYLLRGFFGGLLLLIFPEPLLLQNWGETPGAAQLRALGVCSPCLSRGTRGDSLRSCSARGRGARTPQRRQAGQDQPQPGPQGCHTGPPQHQREPVLHRMDLHSLKMGLARIDNQLMLGLLTLPSGPFVPTAPVRWTCSPSPCGTNLR